MLRCGAAMVRTAHKSEERILAERGRRQSSTKRGPSRNQRGGRAPENEGIIPVLARAVREVEAGVQRRRANPSVRTKFQTVALLARDERTRVKTAMDLTESQRTEQLKRLDGIGTILAKTAALDASLLSLLAEDAEVSDAAKELKRDMLIAAGLELPDEPEEPVEEDEAPVPSRQVVPQSVISRRL